MRLIAVGAIWLALAGGIYGVADPYLSSDTAKVVGVWLALVVAWLPVWPLYRRWG